VERERERGREDDDEEMGRDGLQRRTEGLPACDGGEPVVKMTLAMTLHTHTHTHTHTPHAHTHNRRWWRIAEG